MAIFIHEDLSGEGDIPSEGSGVTYFRRVFITNTGSAHPIEGGTADRWLGIGWTCMYENITEADSQGPAGQYFTDRQWIEFLAQGFWDHGEAQAILGYSGLHYKFLPGVVATIVTFES